MVEKMMEKKRLADKTRLILIILTTASVVGGLLLWMKMGFGKGEATDLIPPVVVAAMVLIFMIPYIKRRVFDVKAGYPMEDERSKKVMTRALANAYLLSIYWLLALSWASDGMIVFRDVSQAMGAGILGMAVLFGLSYVYVGWRGVE